MDKMIKCIDCRYKSNLRKHAVGVSQICTCTHEYYAGNPTNWMYTQEPWICEYFEGLSEFYFLEPMGY